MLALTYIYLFMIDELSSAIFNFIFLFSMWHKHCRFIKNLYQKKNILLICHTISNTIFSFLIFHIARHFSNLPTTQIRKHASKKLTNRIEVPFALIHTKHINFPVQHRNFFINSKFARMSIKVL